MKQMLGLRAHHGTILAILGGALTVESFPGCTRVTASVPAAHAYPSG